MLLGYDATTIRGNKTGVGYYSSRLLDRLTRVGGDTNPIDELLVLSNRPIAFGPLPRARQVTSGYFPLRAPWMQGVLPFILREMSPDLCHFTNYLAPLALDRPFVVTFHDMTLQLFPQFHRWRKRLLTATIAPAIAKRARLVITPSESTKEDLARILRILEAQDTSDSPRGGHALPPEHEPEELEPPSRTLPTPEAVPLVCGNTRAEEESRSRSRSLFPDTASLSRPPLLPGRRRRLAVQRTIAKPRSPRGRGRRQTPRLR